MDDFRRFGQSGGNDESQTVESGKGIKGQETSSCREEDGKKRRFRIAFFRGERARGASPHTHTHHFHYSRKMEQTYIMIKPDGVQRGLVGKIIQRFEEKGFFLRGMKMMQVEKAHAEKHYADLSSKPFFGDLVDYMCSGPVVCMVWEGKEVVKTGRKIIGATNPLCVTPTLALSSAIRSVPALRRQLRPPLRDAREHAPIAPRRAASHRTDAANFPRRVPWREPTDDPPLTRSAPLRSAPLLLSASEPGTIRGDFCIELGRNVIHGSTPSSPPSTRSPCGSPRVSPPTSAATRPGSTSKRHRARASDERGGFLAEAAVITRHPFAKIIHECFFAIVSPPSTWRMMRLHTPPVALHPFPSRPEISLSRASTDRSRPVNRS